MHDSDQMAAWRKLTTNPFMDLIGPMYRSTMPGERKSYGFLADERHINSVGLIHGGALTSLLDQVMAIEAWKASDRMPLVTVQMDTRFTGAAKAGDFIEARADVRHSTRSLLFVDAELTSGSAAIASATAVMKIIKTKANDK